jgi:hypothetical protein
VGKSKGLALLTNPVPGSLSAKLNIIWYYAAELVQQSERDHEQVIGRAWGRHRKKMAESDSILARAEAAKQNGLLTVSHSGLASAYFGVLGELGLIKKRILNVCADEEWRTAATKGLNGRVRISVCEARCGRPASWGIPAGRWLS